MTQSFLSLRITFCVDVSTREGYADDRRRRSKKVRPSCSRTAWALSQTVPGIMDGRAVGRGRGGGKREPAERRRAERDKGRTGRDAGDCWSRLPFPAGRRAVARVSRGPGFGAKKTVERDEESGFLGSALFTSY